MIILEKFGIRWYDQVRNDEVLQCTSLTSLSRLLSHWCTFLSGHVARLNDDTPANMALQLHIDVSLNRPPDRTWHRPPGCPRNKCLDQLQNDSTHPIGDFWKRTVCRGHGSPTMWQPWLATWRWWWFWRFGHVSRFQRAKGLQLYIGQIPFLAPRQWTGNYLMSTK